MQRWTSAMAWYEEMIDGNNHEAVNFIQYLIEKGVVDDTTIRDAFQSDMILDGFFDTWPDDAPITIVADARYAECTMCKQKFSCEDLEDLKAECIDCEMDGYEESDDPNDEDCPLKVWCRHKKTTEGEGA